MKEGYFESDCKAKKPSYFCINVDFSLYKAHFRCNKMIQSYPGMNSLSKENIQSLSECSKSQILRKEAVLWIFVKACSCRTRQGSSFVERFSLQGGKVRQ